MTLTDAATHIDGSELEAFDFPALAQTGLRAVVSLWRGETQSFRQSSIDPEAQLRPTVTFRCADVLFTIAADRPELVRPYANVIEAVAERIVRTHPVEAQEASTLSYVPFTAALHTLAVARLAASATDYAGAARERLSELTDHLRSELPPEQLSAIHPFVQEHALRAALASQAVLDPDQALDEYIDALQTSITLAVDRLLARHHAALITPAESVVLVFCAAALTSTEAAADDRLALAALGAAASAQDVSGSWPLGRVVREEPSRLEISTYEVAWAVTDTLTRLLGRVAASKEAAEAAPVLHSITRASAFAHRSVVELPDGRRGWSSDHPYQQPRIESWTSAIAVQFALAGEKLRDQVRNRRVLTSFAAISPRDADWPSWLRWQDLASDSEPDASYPIYDYLDRRVIQRIERHPRQLPSGANETASVLLFGPPGTSKTTIVQAVADRLEWPLVFLSPGNFIKHGLEAIEAAAQSVFERLHALRQVVVIFDECDELFRNRSSSNTVGQARNISAFVTASMLPKLQELHDRGKVLFFVCTNHADMIDPAVLRGGRIDHRIGVGPPDQPARAAIIAKFRDELPARNLLDYALRELALRADRFSRTELKRAALKLAASEPWEDEAQASQAVQRVVHSMGDALIITEDLMEKFLEQQQRLSDSYMEKAS
jgi:hypothetical protein